MPTLVSFIIVSAALLGIGIYGLTVKRNAIRILFAVELIVNAANLNFVAFNKYLYGGKIDGLFFTLFLIAIAAAEAAVAIAIIINLYRNYQSIDVEDADKMKWA